MTPRPDDFVENRKTGRRRWDAVKTAVAWSSPATLIVSAVIGYVAISTASDAQDLARAVRRNTDAIEVKEDRAIDLTRRASWRLCERAMRDRALLHAALITPPPDGESPAQQEARRLFRALVERQNPIVDCDPNLVGQPAYALPVKDQRAFVRRWQAGELDPLPEPPGVEPGLSP